MPASAAWPNWTGTRGWIDLSASSSLRGPAFAMTFGYGTSIRNAARTALTEMAAPAKGPGSLATASFRAAAGNAAGSIGAGLKAGGKAIPTRSIAAADALHSTAQGALAGGLSPIVNGLIQGIVSGPATVYDRAMDARFITTGIGGGHHRLFDGGHTIPGAIEAARGASPDDTLIQESLGAVQGLLRDASTPMGLPLKTWDQETFNQVARTLEMNFHIPRSWFTDLNTFTGAELLGGTVGAVATIFAWNRADTESFYRLVGSLGVAAALSANPLLLLLTLVALARGFNQSRRTGNLSEFVDGQARGGAVTGASFAAVWIVGFAGGPVGLALLVAVVAGIFAGRASGRVSAIRIARVMVELSARSASPQGLRRSLAGVGGLLVNGSGELIRAFRSRRPVRAALQRPAW